MTTTSARATLRRPVLAYLGAATLARVADEMVGVAVVLLVIDRTGSTVLAGAVVAAYTLPSLVSGPVLGAWLDRTRHRRLALAGNEIGLAMVAFGMAALTGHVPAPVLLVLAALTGLTLPMTSGGFTSLLPSLVPATMLSRVTTMDAGTFNGAAIAGPALAGTVAATAGSAAAVTVIGAIALVATVCMGGIHLSARDVAEDHPSLPAAVRDGVRHLLRTPPLRGATLASALGLGAVGLLTTALPSRTEQLGAGRAASGYVWAVIEVGAIVGLVLLRRRLDDRPERAVFLAVGCSGAVMLAWPAAGGLAALLPLAVLGGLVNGPNLAALITARQRYSPPALLAQVSTTGASLKLAAFAAGSALGGQLVPVLGAGITITVAALGQLAAAVVGWLGSGSPWHATARTLSRRALRR